MNAIQNVELLAILARIERGEADYKDANTLRSIFQAQQHEIDKLNALISEQPEIFHATIGGDPTFSPAGERHHPQQRLGDNDL